MRNAAVESLRRAGACLLCVSIGGNVVWAQSPQEAAQQQGSSSGSAAAASPQQDAITQELEAMRKRIDELEAELKAAQHPAVAAANAAAKETAPAAAAAASAPATSASTSTSTPEVASSTNLASPTE